MKARIPLMSSPSAAWDRNDQIASIYLLYALCNCKEGKSIISTGYASAGQPINMTLVVFE